ncbi:MAG: sigma-54 dependent transcriptional regulator [Paracoccaceae bacterium]|nr:sigma-54 dependent transcriptional regulator [Paracoccaceae bacterium]
MDGTVLVADDDRTIRTVLTQALTRAGCRVHATSSLTTLMRWVSEGKGDAVITDVMMPDGNGLEMLPKMSRDRPELPVIVISAQNTIMTAIKANEAGAFDYLSKPFDLPDLMKRCAKALKLKKPIQLQVPKNNLDGSEQDVLPLVGKTPAMQGLYRLVAGLMNADLPILVCGESGTGKTLISQMLHNFSDRRNLPFVTVSEADLIEIEGPSKILARAKAGTILFEQVSDINKEYQGRIVRMIDNQLDHSPHFIATMNEDANQAVEKGTIRRDLYYRLSGATIQVPALRERVDDVILLSEFFLAKSECDGGLVRGLSPEVTQIFRSYSWPGNVRQLENVIKLLALTARSASISLGEAEQVLKDQPAMDIVQQKGSTDKLASDVERHLRRYFDLHGNLLPAPGLYGRIVREIETPLIELALEATGGNQAKCADLLGINRNTLRKKINELDIKVTRRRKLM